MGETSMAKTERMEARGAKRWKIWESGIFGQRRPVASHGGKRALQLGICAVVLSVPGILSLFWGAPVTATLTQGQDEVAQNHPQDHPQDLPEIQPRLTGSDCSFLEDPDAYEGLDGRHRIDLSRRTEEVTGELLMQTAATLVPAQGIPRRNFIDQHLFDKMARAGVNSAPLSTDEEFLRRVTLDLTGRLPEPNTIRQFLQDTSANKRDQLVDRLIASPEFVDKWTLFLGDLFRNNSNSTAIQRYASGREAFHKYLQESLQNNRGYNLIASDLLTAEGNSATDGPVNFIVGGNVPMGPAQDTYDGLAVQASTIFLGLNSMDCLLCHDGAGHLDAVNLWGSTVTRAQAYGMSAFFSRARRAFQRGPSSTIIYGTYTVTEAATGDYLLNTNSGNRQTRNPINGQRTVTPQYLGTGAGANASETRRQAFARHLTSDPQFARAAVNYLWEELMVEALVSPSDNFDLARLSSTARLPDGWTPQPHNPELLEALALDFRNNGYNLRRTIGTIVKSSAYQLSSQYPGTWKLEYVPLYARKFVRRLKAEEIHDAIIQATGLPPVTAYRAPGATTNTTVLGYPIINEEGQKLREVLWAGQLPEPLEPRQRADVRAFLDSFLRGNRDSIPRSEESSIMQALNMMNNTFVTARVRNADQVTFNGQTYRSTVYQLLNTTGLTNDQLVTELTLRTLSRMPTAQERTRLTPYFTRLSRQAATESLQWALLNKVDFLFNY